MAEMTQEQKKLHEDLVAEYGEKIVGQARDLSGISLCVIGLLTDELSVAERQAAYQRVSGHLARLLESMMSPDHSAKVTACAKRLDAAIEVWTLDELEQTLNDLNPTPPI